MANHVASQVANQAAMEPTDRRRWNRGRNPLKAGTHGEITTTAWVIDRVTGKERRRRLKATADHKADSKRTAVAFWTAEAYVRTDKGRTRYQSRGKTKDEAIERLSQRMRPPTGDRLAEALATESGRVTAFTNDSTLGEVLDAWITDPITTDARAVGTVLRYRHAIDKTIKKRNVGTASLGSVSLDRVTPRVVTLFLASLTPAVAKTCRGILRQALTYAVANGASAPTTNGTFAILSQRVERGAKSPTAPTVPITKAQAAQIIADLKADEKTSTTDLPDILTFMAGTGCRTGEAIALTWAQLDLDSEEPTALINATVNGAGRRQLQTKTRAGVRRLALPPAVVTMLQGRLANARPDSSLVFPSARGPKSDRAETPYWISNITGVIRTELDRLGHVGVTGRSFRKMVATELDKTGFTPRQIADQLGHSRPSVTMDVYQNREATGPTQARTIL